MQSYIKGSKKVRKTAFTKLLNKVQANSSIPSCEFIFLNVLELSMFLVVLRVDLFFGMFSRGVCENLSSHVLAGVLSVRSV